MSPSATKANEPCDWVLLRSCGCCVGVCTYRHFPNEDKAWKSFFPTRAEEREAHKAGYTLKLVTHQEWAQIYHAKFMANCSHRTVAS